MEQLQNTPHYCSGIYFAHFSIERGMRSNKLTFKINSSQSGRVFCKKNVHSTCLKYSREMSLEINVEKADLRIFMTRTIDLIKFQNPYKLMVKTFMNHPSFPCSDVHVCG